MASRTEKNYTLELRGFGPNLPLLRRIQEEKSDPSQPFVLSSRKQLVVVCNSRLNLFVGDKFLGLPPLDLIGNNSSKIGSQSVLTKEGPPSPAARDQPRDRSIPGPPTLARPDYFPRGEIS